MNRTKINLLKSTLGVLFACCLHFMGAAQEANIITGSVKTVSGQPLSGVTITVKTHTGGGSYSKDDGTFSIHAQTGATLVFSYVGYQTQEIATTSDVVNVILTQTDTVKAQDVVVTAFGIKKQERSLGYAVSTITAKDITETGATNVASALYGKAAGVKIQTPPGGASTAVSVQIRGVSSVSNNTQPLYVVDGVPIRLYNDLAGNNGSYSNNNGYYSDIYIEGNGILDINPDDIASMTILKGAAAAALYGSEGTNGVVVITTKKGSQGRGLGVDLNYVLNQEKVAYGPDYQNEYGPGDGPAWAPQYDGDNVGQANPQGWITDPTTGIKHPFYGTSAQFGPAFDGSQVEYWDGTMRAYNAQPNNWKQFYQTGYNSAANIAVSGAGDKGNFRISYTRTDYKSIMPGSNLNKNNVNFNGTLILNKAVSVDLVSTYNYSFTHNRPTQMGQIFGSDAGFFSRFDDMNTYKTRYETTDGYQYVPFNGTAYDTSQRLAFPINATNLMGYFWTALRDIHDETQNRFINSVTLNVAFTDHLKFRGRIGNDYTNYGLINDQHNTEPTYVGNSGEFYVVSNVNTRLYWDAYLTYSNKFNSNWSYSIMGAATEEQDGEHFLNSYTNEGLIVQNYFTLTNSVGPVQVGEQHGSMTEGAGFGTLSLNYKDLLYLEGTGRWEGVSTLPSNNDIFFYPSVNAGFILSDAVKLPKVFSYAKIRASYAEVGNYPYIYQANILYNQNTIPNSSGNNVLYQATSSSSYGNNSLKSELKKEMEFGLETRMFENKIGLDLSYYNNKDYNMILPLSIASSTGSQSVVANAGTMSNWGIEAALDATPVAEKYFKWTTRFNFALNRNKMLTLPNGQSTLQLSSQDGGYAIIQAQTGSALGNIYTHPIQTDNNGNYITGGGYYQINTNAYQLSGNIMPKFTGGWVNTITYRQFSLDLTIDYRFGGDLLSIPTYYQIGEGMYKNTLQYRDAAHGGLSYNLDANYNIVPATNGAFHDGVVLKGVNADGTPNTTMIDASQYWQNMYAWEFTGSADYSKAVFKNSYIKFREAALNYNLPAALAHKIHFQGLQLSLIGRNLFYIWKTLPHGLDPEVGVGSSWLSQGIDGGNPAPTRSLGLSLTARF